MKEKKTDLEKDLRFVLGEAVPNNIVFIKDDEAVGIKGLTPDAAWDVVIKRTRIKMHSEHESGLDASILNALKDVDPDQITIK